MRVGIIGTGAIAHKHALAYRNIGYQIVACAGLHADRGREFASKYGCEFFDHWRDVCRAPLDFVDVLTFPDFRLEAVEECAKHGKHVQVQKPMAIEPATARRMIEVAREAGIVLGVVSQHRFDDASIFLKRGIDQGRLGKIIEADAYVKWWRSDEYYSRAVKGSWAVEGGGALINQGIHQADLLLWFAGCVREVSGEWQLGAAHRIESEDVVNAVIRYRSGATGVIQAATAIRPGYPERLEIHGSKGSATITGDKLTGWDVEGEGDAPVESAVMSGAADPMAISVKSFERQFLDFGAAIREGRAPLVSGEEGYRALGLVDAIYRSCRERRRVTIDE
ncbi:MAG TPA: Gfo/Idh/MocA family oxidoreductase [Bryobacteraceae bacterium]|nr:Gfo/Idh/MocA family oxidoreductase [Bryobacteraceae bacterium]